MLKRNICRAINRYRQRRIYWKAYDEIGEEIKYKIIEKYKNSSDEEIDVIIKYLYENKCGMFPYQWSHNYPVWKQKIFYDKENNLPYILLCEKKVYLCDWDLWDCKIYKRGLELDQDVNSPHCYFNKDYPMKRYRTVLDIGGAEGNFSISIIEQCEKVFIFEGNTEWNVPLELTFREYKDKVKVCNKFIGAKDIPHLNIISLDTYCKEMKDIDLIKMDVEGNELDVLRGAKETLRANPQVELLICVYHRGEDERQIRDFFGNEYECWSNAGYMIVYDNVRPEPPYLRRGVLRVKKKY